MSWVRKLFAGTFAIVLATMVVTTQQAAAQAAPTAVAFPSPGDAFASPQTVLTFRGINSDNLDQVTVRGSVTGPHEGQLTSLPRGLGLTFDPNNDFRPGERVTVQLDGVQIEDAASGTYSFTVATPSSAPADAPLHPKSPEADPKQDQSSPKVKASAAACEPKRHHYVTRPDLGAVPGACAVTPANNTGQGKIFLGYHAGPVMLNNQGEVVWHRPATTPSSTNFRVVSYRGQKMLAYYRGYYVPGGGGDGQTEFVVLNDHYQQVATVHAVNGYLADEHEFNVTPRGTVYIGSYVPVVRDLSEHGGRPGTTIYDYVVQEVDIATNELLFEWHALDHISITESNLPIPGNGARYDWFHGNAIEIANDGNLLISGRHTSTIYKVDRATGEVLWKLGGEDTSFANLETGPGVPGEEDYWFCWQHHIRQLEDGTYTLFDNGGGPGGRCGPSRGMRFNLDPETGTATIVNVYRHSPDLLAGYLGGMQTLPNGNELVQWGNIRQTTEFHRDGSVALDLKLTDMSYRALRFEWTGHPTRPPAIEWRDDGDGTVSIYASWNGATEATSWQLRAGDSVATLQDVGQPQSKAGFETRLSLGNPAHAVRVQALAADGSVLGESPVVFWSAATGAHEVHDPIFEHYREFGTSAGKLEYPTTDTTVTPDGIGRYNHFSGADGSSIYWSPQTGAHQIQGAIRAKWESLGWELGFLGYPVTDETTTPDGIGRFNHFAGEGGSSIYWSPQTGAHEVHGDIRKKWASMGWERSRVAYPITDETSTPDGVGRYNHFSHNGSIYWTPWTGAHAVYGSIRARWRSLGWELSALGYPVSDEYSVPSGRRSDFEHGSIIWDRSTGTTRVVYR